MSRSNRAALVAAFAAFSVLGACATPPNLAGTETAPNRGRNTGIAIGAVAGGLLAGPVTGGNTQATALGAAIGAAAGGLIGADLDRQAAELRNQLGDGITVENKGDSLLVSFPQEILFPVNGATVRPDQRGELVALAGNLKTYPGSRVEVIGHTDNTGTAAYNFDLSTRRAGAVSAVLVENGVAGPRITATGKGEDNPIATNLTEEGKAMNRRVEVVIRPQA